MAERPKPLPVMSRGAAIARGLAEGSTLGWFDRLQARARAGQERAIYEAGGPDAGVFADSAGQDPEAEYQRIRDAEQATTRAAENAHPWTFQAARSVAALPWAASPGAAAVLGIGGAIDPDELAARMRQPQAAPSFDSVMAWLRP